MKMKNFILAVTVLIGGSAYSAHEGCASELGAEKMLKRSAKLESRCDQESWSVALKGQTASANSGPLLITIEGCDGDIVVKGTNKCIDRERKCLTINLAEMCKLLQGIKSKYTAVALELFIDELSECRCDDHHKKPAHGDCKKK